MNKIVLSTLLVANLTICGKTNKSHTPEQPFIIRFDRDALKQICATKKQHCILNDGEKTIIIENGTEQVRIEKDEIRKVIITKETIAKKGRKQRVLGKLSHRNKKKIIQVIKASQIFD